MLFTIAKRFTFDASHQLTTLPDDHKCSRLHGHTYTVEVELGADDLDGHGFVVDYAALDDFKTWLTQYVDHRHLNDCPFLGGRAASAEVLAAVFYQVAAAMLAPYQEGDEGIRITAVRVSETPNTWAEYRP